MSSHEPQQPGSPMHDFLAVDVPRPSIGDEAAELMARLVRSVLPLDAPCEVECQGPLESRWQTMVVKVPGNLGGMVLGRGARTASCICRLVEVWCAGQGWNPELSLELSPDPLPDMTRPVLVEGREPDEEQVLELERFVAAEVARIEPGARLLLEHGARPRHLTARVWAGGASLGRLVGRGGQTVNALRWLVRAHAAARGNPGRVEVKLAAIGEAPAELLAQSKAVNSIAS